MAAKAPGGPVPFGLGVVYHSRDGKVMPERVAKGYVTVAPSALTAPAALNAFVEAVSLRLAA